MKNNLTLPKGRVIQYFLADIAKGLFNGMIGNYLLYFYQPTAKSGLPFLMPGGKLLGFITIMALLTGLSKVVDAITDPIVANLSDKCTNRFGRRLPFMRISAIPYAFCVLMIFYAPFATGSAGNAVWVGFFLIAYYVFYTLYFIPHRALVPEILPDPKQRVGFYAISTVFFMGSSAVMYATTFFVKLFKDAGLSVLWSWRAVFTIFAIVGAICLLVSAFAFNEKKYVRNTSVPQDSFFKSVSIVFKNKNFVIFTLADLFSYISMAFFQTAMLYYITVLINVPESQSFIVMLAAIVTAIICFPIILRVSKKYNKKLPLIIASVMFTVVFTFIYFGDNIAALMPGNELVLGIIMGISVAFPFAAINILPQSALSDIIQADSIKSGVNREGMFSAIKTFVEKISYAVAMVIVSGVLSIGATGDSQAGLQGIKLTGIFAAVFSLLSLIFFILYNDKAVMDTINKARHSDDDDDEEEHKKMSITKFLPIFNAVKSKKNKRTVDAPNVNVDSQTQDEYVQKLQNMIRCKTVSDKDVDETEFEKFRQVLQEQFPLLHQKAEHFNFDGCLVYKISGESDRNIILMSHHDVVSAEGEWKYPPFDAQVADGVMYGRGTIDTKTPLFAELQAVEELLKEEFVFPVNVYIATSNNEEVCGEGILHAVDYFKQNGIHFEMVLDEGGAIVADMMPGVKEKCAMIAVHEKGRHTFVCSAKKDDNLSKGHSGLTGLSDNPVSRMAGFIKEAEQIKWKQKLYPEVKSMFEHCAPNMSFGLRLIFANLDIFEKPLVKLLPKIAPPVGAMLGTGLTFTQIESFGGSEQVRPQEVQVTAFFRCVREKDLKRDLAILQDVADKYGIEIQPQIVDYCKPADFNSDAFKFVESVLNKQFPNVIASPYLLTAGTDARRLTDVADNIFRFAPISLSKEQFATVHSANENIGIDSIGEAVCFYKRIVSEYK